MATLATPVSAGVLTADQFAPQYEYPAASSAALTEPGEQAFTFSPPAHAYRVIVRSVASPASASALPAWVQPTVAGFVAILNLVNNWDSYGGKPINRDLINQSLSILEMVMQPDSPVPSIVPMGDGGLQIEWHRRHQDLEIAFAADSAPQFFYRDRATGAFDEGSPRETEKLIRFLRNLA